METLKRLIEREAGTLAVAAAGLAAAGLVLALPDQRPTPEGYSISPARPLAPAPSAAPFASNTGEPDAGPMSLDEFLSKLEKSAPAPVAASFAKAFLGHAPLKRVLARAKRENAPARDFLRRVTRLPQFRQLMREFRSEPGFQRAFLRLSREVEMNATARGESASASPVAGKRTDAPRNAFRQESRPDTPAGEGSRASARGLAGGGPPAARQSLDLAAWGYTGALGPRNVPPPPSVAAELTAGSEGPAGDERTAASGAGRETIRTLAPLASAGAGREAGPFLDSLFATAPRGLREALLYQCEVNELCDPVGACVAAGVFDLCVAACEANPACGDRGLFPRGYDADSTAQDGARTDRKGIGEKKPRILRESIDDGRPLPGDAMADGSFCPGPERPPAPGPADGLFIGSVIGGLAGGFLGAAIGGPVGGVLGAVVGAGVGGFIGEALIGLGLSW